LTGLIAGLVGGLAPPIIAAIVIAAIVGAGAIGGGAYATYTYGFKGEFTNKSDIYKPETQVGKNEAFDRHSVFDQPPVANPANNKV